MALLPQSESASLNSPISSTSTLLEKQPRQPTSLQGLMRFALETTRSEDAPMTSELGPMDEERKKFLEEALSSMTIDVVQVLQKQIQILRGVEHMTDDEVVKYLKALDNIMDHVDNIDIANDFHKIGGFTILYPCLKCPYAKIRAMCCELVAVVCQNNNYCQKVVLDNEFVPFLLNMIENDEIPVVIKAIYALGGIIRENAEGISQFLHYRGLAILLKCLKGNNDNVIIKTCFLLSAVCRIFPEVKDQLVQMGFVKQLLTLFKMDRCSSHEYVLSLLVSVMEDCPAAVKEATSFPYNIKDLINRYIGLIRNKDFFEEEEYCKRILLILNAER